MGSTHKHCHHKNYKESCIEALRENGGRITKSRLAVIDCLDKQRTPLSAPDIFNTIISNNSPALDKVTVYRILDILEESGLVHRVNPSGNYIGCFHLSCGKQFHVMSRCIECNEVNELDVPDETVKPLLDFLKKKEHFSPDKHMLHIDGCCRKCSHP